MKVTGFCRLTKDPERGETKNGKIFCKGSLAWNEKDRDESHFIDLVAWGKIAEDLSHLHKGDALNLEGILKQDKWKDKETGQNRSKHVITVMAFETYKSSKDDFNDQVPF